MIKSLAIAVLIGATEAVRMEVAKNSDNLQGPPPPNNGTGASQANPNNGNGAKPAPPANNASQAPPPNNGNGAKPAPPASNGTPAKPATPASPAAPANNATPASPPRPPRAGRLVFQANEGDKARKFCNGNVYYLDAPGNTTNTQTLFQTGRYATLDGQANLKDGYLCNNAFIGQDPEVGRKKKCFCDRQNKVEPELRPHWQSQEVYKRTLTSANQQFCYGNVWYTQAYVSRLNGRRLNY